MDKKRINRLEKQIQQLTRIVATINKELADNKTTESPNLPTEAVKRVAEIVAKYKGRKRNKHTANRINKKVAELLMCQWNILGIQVRCNLEVDENKRITNVKYKLIGIPVCDPLLPHLLKESKDGRPLKAAVDDRGILHYEWEKNPNFGYLNKQSFAVRPTAFCSATDAEKFNTHHRPAGAYPTFANLLSDKPKEKKTKRWCPKWLSLTKLIPKRDPLKRYRKWLLKKAKVNNWCVLSGLPAPAEPSIWQRSLALVTLGLLGAW